MKEMYLFKTLRQESGCNSCIYKSFAFQITHLNSSLEKFDELQLSNHYFNLLDFDFNLASIPL